jgi:large subunit ribosomal protein L17
MKHAVKGKQLNRDIGSRRSLFKNLMLALIKYGQINTTEAKAKAMRTSFEKLITKARVGSVQYRRLIDEVLNQHSAVNRLVDEIAPAMKRTSGFTRITKLGPRRGDAADMVRLEIIDWKPKVVVPVKKATKVKAKVVETTHIPKVDEKIVSKVKRPTATSTQVKHIPQKRIAGGGK